MQPFSNPIMCAFGLIQDRFISKMFVRGDSVILVLSNPGAMAAAAAAPAAEQQ
jgi:hypothetical protein